MKNWEAQPHHSFFFLLSPDDSPFGKESRKDYYNSDTITTTFGITPTPYRMSNLKSSEIMNPDTDPRFLLADTPDEFKQGEYDFEQDRMWDYNYVPTMEQFWEYIKGKTNKRSPAIDDAFRFNSIWALYGSTNLGYWKQGIDSQSINADLKDVPIDDYITWSILGRPPYDVVGNRIKYKEPSIRYGGEKIVNSTQATYFFEGLTRIGEKVYQKTGVPEFKNYYAMMYAIDNPKYMDMLLLGAPEDLEKAGIKVMYEDNKDFTETFFQDVERFGYNAWLNQPVSYEMVNDNGEVYLLRSRK